MKNLELYMPKASSYVASFLSVLILSNSSLCLSAGEADMNPSPQAIEQRQVQQVRPESKDGFSRFFRKIGDAFTGKSGSVSASGEVTPPTSINRRIMPSLQKDGNCLVLDKGEEFYPFYEMPAAAVQPTTYQDPRLPEISFTLNGLAPEALKQLRATGDVRDWPIVIIGPVRFCGSVELQLQADLSKFVGKRNYRVEIGPNVFVYGTRNVNIVSSQLKNLEVTAACVGKIISKNEQTCIRIEDSRRTSPNHMLYFKHDGPRICHIEDKNLNDLELRVVGFSKSKPLSCKWVADNSATIEDIQEVVPVVAPTQVVAVVGPAVVAGPVTTITPVVNCDGPYVALIRPTEVSLDYGLRPTTIAPIITAPEVVPAAAIPIAKKEKVDPKTLKTVDPKTLKTVDPKTLKTAKLKADKKGAPKAAGTAADPMINAPRGDH